MENHVLIAVARLEERLVNAQKNQDDFHAQVQRTLDELKIQVARGADEMRANFKAQEEDLKAQLEDIRTKYTLLSRFTLVERLVFGMVAVVLATVLGAILAGAIPIL